MLMGVSGRLTVDADGVHGTPAPSSFSPLSARLRSRCTVCARTESVWRLHTREDRQLHCQRRSHGGQATRAPSQRCTQRHRRTTQAPCRTRPLTPAEPRERPNRRRTMHSNLQRGQPAQHRNRRYMSRLISHTRLRHGKQLLRLRLQALPPTPLPPLRVPVPTRAHRVVTRPLPLPPLPPARSFCRT